ncbi:MULTISPECIES: TauD/TfdA family dioxygenase [unclassified Streptomyces]|uniref:TauD/TfdA family dioxygenase n=1 Tax=unclassified Streptomyces TaxID=2593676 RepID=UPI002E1485C6|nr:TauD/TfdA family dioxygenase [Streptomyces sp. NBC_01197]WSS49042.1 TauD/TfdA family dioxygenase [Streptomyces sp. NBC_01180]
MPEIVNAGRDCFIDLPEELIDDLIDMGRAFPAWSVDGSFLSASTIVRYRTNLGSIPLFPEIRDALLAKLNVAAGGYAVVRLGAIVQALGVGEQFLRLATAILAEVAVPFQPFRRWPLWKEIGTNLNANPGLSTGTGYNAFHMDLVNVTQPPDYTTLLCVRPDPLGAGASILSDARAAVSRLAPASRTLLSEEAYSYGSFFDLSDVGKEYSPFPVLDGERAHLGFVRFTAKMLVESGLGEEHARAARELADQMVAGQVSFTLQRGDFLIVNQHRWVHGREPLGAGQQAVAPEARRLLLQLFLRSAEATGPAAS